MRLDLEERQRANIPIELHAKLSLQNETCSPPGCAERILFFKFLFVSLSLCVVRPTIDQLSCMLTILLIDYHAYSLSCWLAIMLIDYFYEFS